MSGDALASPAKFGDDIALEKAGAIVTTVDQIISELAIDWTSTNGQKLSEILKLLIGLQFALLRVLTEAETGFRFRRSSCRLAIDFERSLASAIATKV